MTGDIMVEIKRLDKSHHKAFKDINNIIRQNLTNSTWFMPFSEENLGNTFDEKSSLVIYGAFVDGVLAAVSLIDTNEDEFNELAVKLGVKNLKGAELGGSMVLPEYRGKNLMYKINAELIDYAKKASFEYLVATAHPDNIASNSSLKKLNMEYKIKVIRTGGYERNVYIMYL